MTEQSVIASASSVAFEPPRFSTVDEERAHSKGHLAVAYRFFAHMGYDHWVARHITVRDPEFPDRFWVNPFGRSWAHLRASDLLLVDIRGALLEGDGVLNAAAFAIHSEVHRARPDVVAAAHAHTRFGRANIRASRPAHPRMDGVPADLRGDRPGRTRRLGLVLVAGRKCAAP